VRACVPSLSIPLSVLSPPHTHMLTYCTIWHAEVYRVCTPSVRTLLLFYSFNPLFLFGYIRSFVGRLGVLCPRVSSKRFSHRSLSLLIFFSFSAFHVSMTIIPHLFYFIHRLFFTSRHSMSLSLGHFFCLLFILFTSLHLPASHTM
jgi:hypothetical protein